MRTLTCDAVGASGGKAHDKEGIAPQHEVGSTCHLGLSAVTHTYLDTLTLTISRLAKPGWTPRRIWKWVVSTVPLYQ